MFNPVKARGALHRSTGRPAPYFSDAWVQWCDFSVAMKIALFRFNYQHSGREDL
jgi:hypothetical protein